VALSSNGGGIYGATKTAWEGGHDNLSNNNHDDEEEYYTNRNHYDDPKLSKQAELDLQMNPGEDCAMFYGLEVLDASQYRVVGTGASKRIIIEEHDDGSLSPGEQHRKENCKNDNDEVAEDKVKSTMKKRKKDTEQSKQISENENQSKKGKKSDKAFDDDKSQADSNRDKRKQKKKKSDKESALPEKEEEKKTFDSFQQTPKSNTEEGLISPEELARIQLSWSESCGGAHIHTRLLQSLHRLGFSSPTPIQAATLSASIMGRRNLVGAAPTGSGTKYSQNGVYHHPH
jgi:hypothetical protein